MRNALERSAGTDFHESGVVSQPLDNSPDCHLDTAESAARAAAHVALDDDVIGSNLRMFLKTVALEGILQAFRYFSQETSHFFFEGAGS
jgi:hypothetical protein